MSAVRDERTRGGGYEDPYKIPSLDALADGSEFVLGLAPAARAAVLLRVAAILTAISAVPATEAAPPSGLPLTLGLQEAAQLLGISPGTLRHRASKPPYQDLRVNNGTRRLRFSSARIVEYMHRGAAHPRRSGPRIGRRP